MTKSHPEKIPAKGIPATGIASGGVGVRLSMPAVPVSFSKYAAQLKNAGEEEPVQKKAEEEERLQMKSLFQLKAVEEKVPLQKKPFQLKSDPVQKSMEWVNEPLQKQPFQLSKTGTPAQTNTRPNQTGMPNNLKAGVEALSGIAMDDVKVHYNSDKPAQLQALAYAQGTDIHIAPGQERHLPHEAWHVVQQKQGRVQPTRQMKGGVAVNDDKGLESEADVMGGKAIQPTNGNLDRVRANSVTISSNVYQRLVILRGMTGLAADVDTTNLIACQQQVNDLADKNNMPALRLIQRELEQNGTTSGLLETKTNDERLLALVKKLIKDGPQFADKAPMGFFEKRTALGAVANQPDANPAYRPGINVWVLGDRARGIVWGAIGNHLRGLINFAGYREMGIQCSLLLPVAQQNTIDQQDEPDKSIAYAALAQNAFTASITSLTTALGNLPDFNGTSYRQAGLANNTVYNGQIAQGDIIMDKAFWSTSIFRGAGAAGGSWTNFGTLTNPVAYYIINGASGKYIAKYAAIEGEQEVLFRERTAFQVTRIVNLHSTTFFVYVTEVPPPAHGTVIKDPYTGAVYP